MSESTSIDNILKNINQNLELAVESIISGKCKSEGVIYIEEAMEELKFVVDYIKKVQDTFSIIYKLHQ